MLSQTARPQTFKEVAGQKLAKELLISIIRNPNKSPRSLLLTGEYGTGKTTTARIFARALNCPNKKDYEPCNRPDCPICSQDINNSSFYQEYDSTIIGNVESIRELRDTFYYNVKGQYKVVVLDECFTYDTPILTLQGNKMVWESIGKIVNNHKQLKVITIDSNGNIEPKEIIGWHKLKAKNDIKRYVFTRTNKDNYWNTEDNEVFIEATLNHPVYTSINETTPISQLNIGDSVIGFDQRSSIKRLESIKRKHSYYNISEECFQILLGCILGDGSISHIEQDNWMPRFRFSQSEPRVDLFNRVQYILGDLLAHTKYHEVDGSSWSKNNKYILQSKCREELKALLNLTYNNQGTRWLHQELFNIMNPIALAFHFMCDGSWSFNRMHLSLHRYTKKEVLRYQAMLKDKWNINTIVMKDDRCFGGEYKDLDNLTSKGYYLVTDTFDDTTMYASLIAPYLTKDCMYKINNLFSCDDLTQFTEPIRWVTPKELNIKYGEYVLDRVEDIRDNSHNSFVYDLTIEDNHNYIANHILVHNCHSASKAAQTSLLKVIEEAPQGIFFLFPTTHAHQLLPTIVSRCLEIHYYLVPSDNIIPNLLQLSNKYGLGLSKDNDEDMRILTTIAHKSGGHMRNAHMLLDNLQLLGKEKFLESVTSIRPAICNYYLSILKKDTDLLFNSISDMLTSPLADIVSELNEINLNIIKCLTNKNTNTPEGKLANAYGMNFIKITKVQRESWFINSTKDDISFQTALLSIYNMINK